MSVDMPTAMSMYCEAILKPNLSLLRPEPYKEARIGLVAAYKQHFGIAEAEALTLIDVVSKEWVNAYYDSDGSK